MANDEDWKKIPDYDLEDMSHIKAMSREEIEQQLQTGAKHLVEVMKLMLDQDEMINYLERTVAMLCQQLQALHPELEDSLTELLEASDIKPA